MSREPWAVGRERQSGVATRGGGDDPLPNPSRLALVFAVVILLLTLPIFAHGCHRGDHDDEPLFVPMDHHARPPELPQ